MSEMLKLFNQFGSDKSQKHLYHLVYETYFEKIKKKNINLLEIGTFNGASTEAFYNYFPNGTIYTIDIFTRNKPENLSILKKNRVQWLKSDSTDPSLADKIKQTWGDIKFDYIIDDGAHWPMANLLTFKNCMPFLTEGGIYFIEDVWPLDRMSSTELNNKWLRDRPEKYNELDNKKFLEYLDNYHVTHQDLRKLTGNGDSYVIEVRHV